MPRLARLDAPEVLHYVMGRGIEKKEIFLRDQDRSDFLSRRAALGEKNGWTSSLRTVAQSREERVEDFRIRFAIG